MNIKNMELYYDARTYEYQKYGIILRCTGIWISKIWNYITIHGHMNTKNMELYYDARTYEYQKYGIILRSTGI
jgi:hypothetical protein